ncbi:MAG: hypothetical protein PWQ83_1450, partial [Thermosipho sp. (in: thermotogales)]|nr:hypothetical protein [Thermosipho sp. (in: thermotogales)]
MIVYLTVNFLIILFGVLYLTKNPYSVFQKQYSNKINNLVFIFMSFVLLFFISGFRGDFTTDYKNYMMLFHYYNRFDFIDVFHYKFGQEIGYVLLNKVVGVFTNKFLYLMVITTVIILYLYFKELKRSSSNIWLSVFMFVTVGDFYPSFNITRQIMAGAIIFSASKFLYERKMFKYFIFVFFAALFHKTALIMMLFYFLLNLKINKMNLSFIFVILGILYININDFLSFILKFFYSHYSNSIYALKGYSYKNVILNLGILLFVFSYLSKLDLKDNSIRIWINSVIYYAFFAVLGLKVQVFGRLSHYFAPYVLLIIP